MSSTHQVNEEQTALWNGPAGRAWVEAQVALDQVFRPLEDLLVRAVANGRGSHVLDVGCGTGSTTLAIARRLGAKGRCTGVDISEVMISAARARAERESTPARFIRADAQTHTFEPASFDCIVSRFGVMFFADYVQAFANLRRAARDGALLHFVAWRSAAENPFMTTAERAAAPLVPNIPTRQQDAPGQFAFADRSKVCASSRRAVGLISPFNRSMRFVRFPSGSWSGTSPCWARSGVCFTRSTSTHVRKLSRRFAPRLNRMCTAVKFA